MVKVLISAPSLDVAKNVSGVSSVVMQITRVLSSSVKFRHLEIGSEQRGGFFVRLIVSLSKSARSLFTLLTSRYDILHSNTAMVPKSIIRDLAMVAAARLRGKPVLLHVHGGRYVHDRPPTMLRWAQRLLFHLSGRIVVLSRTELSYFTRNYPETARKTEYIYNGTAVSDEAAAVDRTASALGQLRVVFVGRLAPEKGLSTLISACLQLKDTDQVDLDFFGKGDLLPDVLALTQQKTFVKYRGIFQPAECRAILESYDALVLPSLRGEGMPMAVIEAMSAGTIPICTPISSIPEIIIDDETGLLIEPGSPDAIVAAFMRLKQDAPARRRMGSAAYEFAKANLDAKQNFGKLKSIYDRLCVGP
jgi:glycosyltransferase involved in cell wall biosynthesis